MSARLAIVAANVTALITNTQPVPTAAIRNPATAGPISLAMLNDVEFRATAFGSESCGTISPTKVCRAGASKAAITPSRNANT